MEPFGSGKDGAHSKKPCAGGNVLDLEPQSSGSETTYSPVMKPTSLENRPVPAELLARNVDTIWRKHGRQFAIPMGDLEIKAMDDPFVEVRKSLAMLKEWKNRRGDEATVRHFYIALDKTTMSNLSETIQAVMKTTSLENRPVPAELLHILAKNYCRSWRRIGGLLGIPEDDIKYINMKYPHLEKEKSLAMFQEWKNRRGHEATVSILQQVLKEDERIQLTRTISAVSRTTILGTRWDQTGPVPDELLHIFARNYYKIWVKLGRNLGIPEDGLRDIDRMHQFVEIEKSLAKSQEWNKWGEDEATVSVFQEALEKTERSDLSDLIQVVPGRPRITKPKDQVETSFTLTWERPAYDGGDPNIKHKVEWRKKPIDSNPFPEEVDNIGETNLLVTDLEGGEDCEFKVFAKNKEGYSDPATRSYSVQRRDASPLQVALKTFSKKISKDSNLRLVSDYVMPGRPRITNPEDQVETSFTLTWERPAYDGGDPNIKYKVEWRKKPVDSNPFPEEVDNIGETNLLVTDLEGGEDYEFKVFAKNKEGYSDPATRSYSVQRRDAPQHQASSPEVAAAAAAGPSALSLLNAPVHVAAVPGPSAAPQQEAPLPEVAAAAAPAPTPPQQEAPLPEVAAATAPEPSEHVREKLVKETDSDHALSLLNAPVAAVPGPSAAPQQEAPLPEVAAAAAPAPSAPPQQEAPLPEVAAATASEPSVPPQHQAPPPEVAAAAAPGPSEVETRGLITYEEASDPVCKDDISIVTATRNFEAKHKECVRVLPYTKKGGQRVVQFYVFSGESGIPEHLKLAAQECFREMEVEFEWSDLYNDIDDILKATPLQYPSGEPKRLNSSQVDEISKIISKNLHVLDQHRNVTSAQASFKITQSKQTENPCIMVYVLGKGSIPIGESELPKHLGPYPVDVVDGFWLETRGQPPWQPNEAQVQSKVLCWGTSIGIQEEEASGTLGAIVEDGDTLYALSCNHVMRHAQKTEIIHPGWDDHLNYLKYNLEKYGGYVKRISEPDSLFSAEDLTDYTEIIEKFEELKSIKKSLTSEQCKNEELDRYEKDFERGLKSPPRVIGNYSAGLSENVKWPEDKDKKYFVDVAIAKLTPKEENTLRKQKDSTPKIHLNPVRPSGKCSEATINAIMDVGELCKSGRTTEYTTTHRLVGSHVVEPMFMKPPFFKVPGLGLYDTGAPNFFCKTCAEQRPSQSEIKEVPQTNWCCQSCQESVTSRCEEHWRENCLCIVDSINKRFASIGDSGAVIFERKAGLPGFGIIFAMHLSTNQSCVIASPLQVALEALSKQISEKSNLRLVSNYAVPLNQASPSDSPEAAALGPNVASQHQVSSPEVVATAAPEPSVVPGRPTITKLEDQVETSFTLTWKRPAYDGGDLNMKYKVEWRKKPVDSNPFSKEVDNIGETSLTVTDLEWGEDYEFKVFAKNKEGYSDPATRSYSVQRKDGATQNQTPSPE